MRPPLLRPGTRVVAGVCSGLATHLGWQVGVVRLIMAALIPAGGAGLVLYGWLWIMVPTSEEAQRLAAGSEGTRNAALPGTSLPHGRAGLPAQRTGVGAGQAGPAGPAPDPAPGVPGEVPGAAGPKPRPWNLRPDILAGLALVLVAGAVAAARLGLEPNWNVLLPVAAVAGGAVLAWWQLDETRRAGLVNRAGADRTSGALRLAMGVLMVTVGVVVIVLGAVSWDVMMGTLLAAAAVLGGVALVFAPWAVKFWRDLQTERAGRIRQTERAEIAAHLHDSVLQTLALIQNRAASETDVIRLARAQERELREWLYNDRPAGQGQLSDGLKAAVSEVEAAYGCTVDFVAVGDVALSGRTDALVQAARAALLNAAQHASGAVSMYLECGTDQLEVFIRDRGPGFDLNAVPADRIGVRESIIGRMHRAGGSAAIRSGQDGTEVRLQLARGDDVPAPEAHIDTHPGTGPGAAGNTLFTAGGPTRPERQEP